MEYLGNRSIGFLDFFKKKPKDNSEEVTEEKLPISSDESDDSSPGWDAITAEFERIYPEQTNPKHYGTIIKYILGGPDPLDGISVYDGGDFWHFVSYGLSELYVKENKNLKYSGYGIELTFKLKKSNAGDDDSEIMNGCGLLQNMARYIFKTGNVILPLEYVYTKQESGIDAKQSSKLTGFITAHDDLVDTIQTPHGQVDFVTLIGARDAELRSIYESDFSTGKVQELLEKLGHQLTDYDRGSLV